MKHDRIEVKPGVMTGKPVIKGTRLTVELVLRELGHGTTVDELVELYPRLASEDVKAALAYAADVLSYKPAAAADALRRGPAHSLDDLLGESSSVAAE